MKDSIRKWLTEQFGEEEELIQGIYLEYVSSSVTKITELEAALTESNWDQVDRIAHTLKGNALMTGDKEIADTAIALRVASKAADMPAARPLAEMLAKMIRDLQEDVSK